MGDNYVTHEEMMAHLDAVSERCARQAGEISAQAAAAAVQAHMEGCIHGKALDRHISKIAGVVAGVAACSGLIGALIAIVAYHVFGVDVTSS